MDECGERVGEIGVMDGNAVEKAFWMLYIYIDVFLSFGLCSLYVPAWSSFGGFLVTLSCGFPRGIDTILFNSSVMSFDDCDRVLFCASYSSLLLYLTSVPFHSVSRYV
jgi:hypothetical protein